MVKRGIWIIQVASLEARKRFQYRFDFWITTVGSAFGQIVLAYAVWSAVFTESGKSEIGGFSFPEMMGYYLLATLLTTTLKPAYGSVSEQIYQGELSKYLLYPVSTFTYFAAQYAGKITVTALQGVCAIGVFLLFFGFESVGFISVTQALMSLVSFLLAAALVFTISYLVELCAFWVDEVWALMVTFQFSIAVLGGALLPFTVFPNWVSDILIWLPFSAMVWLPIQTVQGNVSATAWWTSFGAGFLWLFAIYFFARVVWNRGRFRYTGVGI